MREADHFVGTAVAVGRSRRTGAGRGQIRVVGGTGRRRNDRHLLVDFAALTVRRILVGRIGRSNRFAIEFGVQCLVAHHTDRAVRVVHVRVVILSRRRCGRAHRMIRTGRGSSVTQPSPDAGIVVQAGRTLDAVRRLLDAVTAAAVRRNRISATSAPPWHMAGSCKQKTTKYTTSY